MTTRLLQGDCLELMKDIPDGSIDMILCDLPYGTTQCKWDVCLPLDKLWEQYKRIIKDNGAICLFSQTPFDKVLGASNLKMLRYEWIWQKNLATGFLNAKKMPLKAHENILVFYKKLPTYNPQMRLGHKPYHRVSHGIQSGNYGRGGGRGLQTVMVNAIHKIYCDSLLSVVYTQHRNQLHCVNI